MGVYLWLLIVSASAHVVEDVGYLCRHHPQPTIYLWVWQQNYGDGPDLRSLDLVLFAGVAVAGGGVMPGARGIRVFRLC
jgi:hypothetical protein